MYQKVVRLMKSPEGAFEPQSVVFKSRSGKRVRIKKVEDPDGLLKIEIAKPDAKDPTAQLTASLRDPSTDAEKMTSHPLKVYTDSADEPVSEMTYMIGSVKTMNMGGFAKNAKKRLDTSNLPH
jgi:hypothetical protein